MAGLIFIKIYRKIRFSYLLYLPRISIGSRITSTFLQKNYFSQTYFLLTYFDV